MRAVTCVVPTGLKFAMAMALALVTACGESKSDSGAAAGQGSGPDLIGIEPTQWTCELITTPADLTKLLGGPTRAVEGSLGVPEGIARPCNYLVEGPAAQAYSFDLDCRDGALTAAEKLFKQYREWNAGQIEAFDAAAGGKPLTNDAGVELRAVEAAREVEVGRHGLDHHGQAILFVDDDAPCYARVVGPDPERRLALARLVAAKLTPANAPMPPHPATPESK